MENLIIIFAFIFGAIVSWLLFLNKNKHLSNTYTSEKTELERKLTETEKQKLIVSETLRLKNQELDTVKSELARNLVILNTKIAENAGQQADIKNLTEKIAVQQTEADNLQKKLTAEFENIANKVLKNRSEEFSETNNKAISEILNPLREKIASFEKKVDDTYEKELRDKISLREELKNLTILNNKVSEEANNLTKALKGDVKKQGNWGEIILERVLERSGLTKGQEYEREEVIEGTNSNVLRPDVIIHLPDNKHIIVDSKVSLIAFEKYISADIDDRQSQYLKEHILSLRNHVKLLSEKNYQNAINLNTPDFVLMFIPVEASFSAAVQADPELFSFAWERKIVIVSPTTLLATLRTISSIWKQENQTKNAQEIARLSGALYDKFVGFTEDMVKIKSNIDKSASAYDDAVKKMKEGNGNIIRTAEKIKELGAKTGSKSLPGSFEL